MANLLDTFLHEIAKRFVTQRPAFAAEDGLGVNAPTLARCKLIATVGDSAKQSTACVACHGAGVAGMQPGIHGLVGLRSNYIVAQLARWRIGDRHATHPDCMKRIATRLSETDAGR